ncbi:hypothetical protein CBR_g50877 [Chara braunii]|uniref:Uncharacterized protein n=1 Tax=Chara braunii TaxID=69332 RepID=A0A388M7S1_CHABU|nr:hypothetical protein CBR_g50877 [Chara braunii]|eukprot:GBG90533.1 hypothetical protein CBR_g50877 [Chara braunii]
MAAAAVRAAPAAAVATSASSRWLVSGKKGDNSGDGCVHRHSEGGGFQITKAVLPPRGMRIGLMDVARAGRVSAASSSCSYWRRVFLSTSLLQRPHRLQGGHLSCGRVSCAMDASASVGGGEAGGGELDEENWPTGPPPVFDRMHIRDPYKRLGISSDASNEEIQEARNYLVQQYKRHEKSVESIEAAFDKIIMEKFKQRKKSKINLKANLKKKVEEQGNLLRQFADMWEVPALDFILKRLFVFVMLGAWTAAAAAAETAPVFQVVVTLAVCVYLLNEKVKSLGRSFLLGASRPIRGLWVAPP